VHFELPDATEIHRPLAHIDARELAALLHGVEKRPARSFRVEQCPMPGWTVGDNWHNNLGYTPGTWIRTAQQKPNFIITSRAWRTSRC
jgi:hypothetical protein